MLTNSNREENPVSRHQKRREISHRDSTPFLNKKSPTFERHRSTPVVKLAKPASKKTSSHKFTIKIEGLASGVESKVFANGRPILLISTQGKNLEDLQQCSMSWHKQTRHWSEWSNNQLRSMTYPGPQLGDAQKKGPALLQLFQAVQSDR